MESSSGMFDMLPEGCIANAISLTTPADACRLSLVSSTFHSAADSNHVWDRFLPSDHQDIIARSLDRDAKYSTQRKKELYLHLSDHPLIIDAGTKSFSLDKMSGKKCYMLAASEISITWGDSPNFWKWTSFQESRFGVVAELRFVWWLEIKGNISKRELSHDTTYAAYMVYKFAEGAYGFDNPPAKVAFGDGGTGEVFLIERKKRRRRRKEGNYARRRPDGWLEVELGKYHVKHDDDEADLEMYLMEIEGGHTKGGILVLGIEIRPKLKLYSNVSRFILFLCYL